MNFKDPYLSAFYIDQQIMCECGMINAVMMSCASSKVALSLAYCLNMRVDDPDRRMAKMRNIIGLTNPEHLSFVESTNLFTEIFTYEEAVDRLPKKTVAYIDI